MSKTRSLTDNETRRWLEGASRGRNPQRDRLWGLMAGIWGLRVEEQLSLQIRDVIRVNKKTGEIQVRQLLGIRREHRKRKKEGAEFRMNPQIKHALLRWVETLLTQYGLTLKDTLWPGRNVVGFACPPPMTQRGIRCMIMAHCDRAGISPDGISTHSFRKRKARVLRRKFNDIKIIKEGLHHTEIKSTEAYDEDLRHVVWQEQLEDRM